VTADFSITGADQMARVARDLRRIDPALVKEMRRGVKEAAQPIFADIKAAATATSRSVGKSITLEVSFSAKTAGAAIKAKRSKMPAGKADLPALFERGSKGGGVIRHPVFGNRAVWVNQPLRRFIAPVAPKHLPAVQTRMLKTLDDAARAAGL
jgi:hypothetical protein